MRTTVRNSYTPKTGDYCNMIVVDQDTGTQYIFDADGVWSTYTSKQQEGAPMGYVNAKAANTLEESRIYANARDAEVLQAAKDYTDQHSGGGVSKQYVDEQDAATLQSAKSYTDSNIPTVNNATLTIQKNSENVATFTANSSTNTTANITVPVFTITDTDPGEGSALAANNFIAVYGIEESE